MADAAVADAVKKQKAADALTATDDDEDVIQDDSGSSDADAGNVSEDTADSEPSESDTKDKEPEAEEPAAEPAPSPSGNLGYTFVPLAGSNPPAAPAANVPGGTKQAATFEDPATGDIRPIIYQGSPDEGGQQYVIDQATGQMVPHAQLATAKDKEAEPPGGTVLPKVDVTAPAPDKLDQVERGQLIGAPAPDQLTQVERGQLVSVPAGTAPKAQPVITDQGYTFVPLGGQQQPPAQAQAPKAEQKPQVDTSTFANPDGTPLPARVNAVGGDNPAAFIMHHTGGRGTVDSVVSTLNERHLGVEFVMDRDGTIYQTGGPGSQNILPGWGPKGSGLSNANIVGMEIIAKDDADVTPAQKAAAARFIAARYPDTPIYGHGEVNPGHKEADEGLSAKAAALAYRAQIGGATAAGEPPAAPQAEPGTKGSNGLYANEKQEDFLTGKATTFATPEDLATGQDNGVGAPKLGKLDTTSVSGVAIPEEALQAMFGNSPAAWRKARVDVVDPSTGKRLRVPIVDLGPRGDLSAITDMTPRLSAYFGGDRNLMVRIVPNAGPDVEKNPQLFQDEQAALKEGFDSAALTKGATKVQPQLGYTFKPVDANQQAIATQADQADQQKQNQVLTTLGNQASSPVAFYKQLNDKVDGVTDTVRQQFQQQLKAEITKDAQAQYGEKDPDKAFARAISDPDIGAVGTQFWRQMLGHFQEYTTVLQHGVLASDRLHVNQFLDQALPNSSDDEKHAFLAKLYAMEPDQRAQILQAYIPSPQAGIPASDPNQIMSALDRLQHPEYEDRANKEYQASVAEMKRNLKSDPRLQGSWVDKFVDTTSQIPSVIAAFGNPAMLPAAAAQISKAATDQIKQLHPEWTDDQVQKQASYLTIEQLLGQEAAGQIMARGVGPLLQTIKSPIQRALATFGIGTAANAVIGGGLQAGANVITGQPIQTGVGEAALGGAIQGGVTGVFHGAGELMRPAEQAEKVVTPPPPQEEKPPIVEQQPPIVEQKPVVKEEPIVKEEPVPIEHDQDKTEDDLNKQNQELDKQYSVEQQIAPEKEQKVAPVEEKPVSADITQGELEQERASDRGQPRQENLGERQDDDLSRRELSQGEGAVQPQLGPVSRALEIGLSPQERVAFQPELDALNNAPRDSQNPQFIQAVRDLREKVIARFQPILDAMGVGRLPDTEGDHFAARMNADGSLHLVSNLAANAQVLLRRLNEGVDPVDYLHSVLQEELIHFGKQLDTRDKWEAAGRPGGDVRMFQLKEHEGILRDAINARDQARANGNIKLANELDKVLSSSDVLYNLKGDLWAKKTPQEKEQALQDILHGSPIDLNNAVHELIRQLVQVRSGNPVTESYFRKLWSDAKTWYEGVIRAFKSLGARLGPGASLAKLELAKAVRSVEARLTQMETVARHSRGEFTPEELRQQGETDRQAREEMQREAQGELARPSGQEDLLTALQGAGGLPHPTRMKELVAKGETHTGELGRVYDAWKALSPDAKKALAKDGITYSKLFSRTAEGLDDTRGNLAQHPDGFNYGTTGELLSQVEEALARAGRGERLYGQSFEPFAPRPEDEFALESQRARAGRKIRPAIQRGKPMEFRWDQPEDFRLEQETTGSGLKPPPRPAPPPDTTGDLFGGPQASGAREEDEPERIRSAAVKYGDKIYEAPTHNAAYKLANQDGHFAGKGETQGFVTQSGRFISRAETYRIGRRSGQMALGPTYGRRQAYAEDFPGGEVPRAPGAPKVIEDLSDALKRARARFGLSFKSGESSMLDYEETRNLARAIRRKPSLVQAYGQRAKLNQLVDAFNSIPRGERNRVKQEFSDYTKAEQLKQPLPAIGADTMKLINAGKDSLEAFGQIAKELNLKVTDSEGRTRPMRIIGREYYPRMISADVRDIFNNRDGSRAADFDNLVNRQIARGVVKDRQEFIDKFTHAINGEPFSNDHFSNLERAREAHLPLDFYDFSPEALLKYASKAQDRLAQVGAFGQKPTPKVKDMFDLAIDKVNQSGNLSYNAKEALINRIAGERQAQYSAGPVSGLERVGSFGRNVASGLYLSNWQTAFRNLVTGAAQNMVFGGPANFIKTAAGFPFGWRKIVTEARDRNLFRANLRNVLDDYDLASNPSWWERTGRWMADKALKYGGHNLTEAINRSFAMQQAKLILKDFARDYGVNDNALSRARTELVKRRLGFRHDEDATRTLTALAREGGVGPLTDEFIRQHVMDVHANYGPSQSPAYLLNSPAGKMLFQFQRWGANASRMMTRDYVAPWTRAMASGSYADKGYHTLRMLGFLAAGTGVGGAFQGIINAIYRRDPKDATLAEIGKMVSKGDYKTAFSYGIQKAYGLMLLSGFSGLFGDYAGMIQEHMGKDPGGRFKDPLHPPAYSIAEPFMALFDGWKGEGGALPSPKLMDDFLKTLSSTYRVGKQGALGLATSAGLKMPLVDEYRAENDRTFTRQRIQMFEDQDPALQQKAEEQGTQARIVSMSGRKPFSPVRDKIINGLLSGHPEEANSAIRDWLSKVPNAEVKAERDKIKANINNNSPLKVGGSTKPDAVMRFLSWAKDNLPEGEARRIFSVASTYAKGALETGLEDKSKPMTTLAKINYDTFQTPKAKTAQQQAAAKTKAEVQGRQIMSQLVKRQQVANQLQGR